MISFYPGPSRVYDEIPGWIKAAHKKGILSLNHRSPEFMAICEDTVRTLKKKLNVPENYSIFFTSSATECWEIIAQSLIEKKSIHIHNGAFGEKWFDYTHRLRSGSRSVAFSPDRIFNPDNHPLDDAEIICLTQNETSNGTQVSSKIIDKIRKRYSNKLLAIDATSSMAGISLDFHQADVWFASVQKCFGLPAGLAVMICSPAAIKRVEAIAEKSHYNSLLFTKEMMDKWQTPYTPNVLGIYLLNCVAKKMNSIAKTHQTTVKRKKSWVSFFKKSRRLQLFAATEQIQSDTIITIKADSKLITELKSAAKKKGLLLGDGYGALKPVTFRIANFPALKSAEIDMLKNFLISYL